MVCPPEWCLRGLFVTLDLCLCGVGDGVHALRLWLSIDQKFPLTINIYLKKKKKEFYVCSILVCRGIFPFLGLKHCLSLRMSSNFTDKVSLG